MRCPSTSPRLALLGGDYDVAVGALRPGRARRRARWTAWRASRWPHTADGEGVADLRGTWTVAGPAGGGAGEHARGGGGAGARARPSAARRGRLRGRAGSGRAGRVDRARRAVARAAGRVGGDRDRRRRGRLLDPPRRRARSPCFKRLLLRLLRQYFVELEARQTRFNLALLERLRRARGAVEPARSDRGPPGPVAARGPTTRSACRRGVARAADRARLRRRRPRGGAWTRAPAATSQPLERLRPGAGDLLVIRYSAYSPRLLRAAGAARAQAARVPQRHAAGLLLEPPRRAWRWRARWAARSCRCSPRAADVCAADSEFNAGELRAAGAGRAGGADPVRPRAGWAARGRAPEGDGPLVLVVGRLAPNKRHDLAIAAFAAWRAEHGARRSAAVRGRAAVARLRAS